MKICRSTKIVHFIQKLNVSKLEQGELVSFPDESMFNVAFANKNGWHIRFIKLRSYFAPLKPDNGNALQCRFKCSCKSINWFFCNRRNWVEAQRLSSESARLTRFHLLWSWVKFSKMRPSLFSFFVWKSRNESFIWVLLCKAKPPRDPIKNATRWWGSKSQKMVLPQGLKN